MADRFSVIDDSRQRPVGSSGGRQEGFTQGGIPFSPPNCQDIAKNGGPCRAPRALGTMYCIGHLRSRGADVNTG